MLLAATTATMSAYDFEVDGIKYIFLNGTTASTNSGGWPPTDYDLMHCTGDIVVPATIHCNEKDYTVVKIGYMSFINNSITSISLPNTLVAIDDAAFMFCGLLEYINIPDEVESIGMYAFDQCLAMTYAVIGKSVASMGEGVFCGNASMTRITLKPVTPPTATTLFYTDTYLYGQATFFVPLESLEAYRAHEEWSKFMHIVPFIGAGPGDVNGDGNISIGDVASLIDQLIGDEEIPAYYDVDGDGRVSIGDITALIDMLLGNN